jgi:hypothetical protein
MTEKNYYEELAIESQKSEQERKDVIFNLLAYNKEVRIAKTRLAMVKDITLFKSSLER